jgi:two-component system response regulator DctR
MEVGRQGISGNAGASFGKGRQIHVLCEGGRKVYSLPVLIAEPDPMLRTLYRKVVLEGQEYSFAGFAENGEEIVPLLSKTTVNLVLLEIALHGFDGLEGFRRMRAHFPRVDFIILSSEKSPDTVRGAICSGAFDYLIKPFEWERLTRALAAYSEYYRGLVGRDMPWRQEDLDRLLGFRKRLSGAPEGAPKGFQETLLIRLGKLLQESRKPLSAANAGRMLGISRSSARRYLELLAERGEVTVDYELSTVGRPQKLYFASGPIVKRKQNHPKSSIN